MRIEYEVLTPFGYVIVTPTGANHLHITSRPSDPVCVNRVYYYISLDLHRTERGFSAKSEDLYGTVYTWPNKDMTPAAREKVLAEIPPLVDNWTRSPKGVEALERQEKIRLNQEVASLGLRIAETENLLESLRKEYANLQAMRGGTDA